MRVLQAGKLQDHYRSGLRRRLIFVLQLSSLADNVKQQIFDDFRMNDLGQAKQILSLRVTMTDDDHRPGAVH